MHRARWRPRRTGDSSRGGDAACGTSLQDTDGRAAPVARSTTRAVRHRRTRPGGTGHVRRHGAGRPELAAADPDQLAAASVTVDGPVSGAGDTDVELTIQSFGEALRGRARPCRWKSCAGSRRTVTPSPSSTQRVCCPIPTRAAAGWSSSTPSTPTADAPVSPDRPPSQRQSSASGPSVSAVMAPTSRCPTGLRCQRTGLALARPAPESVGVDLLEAERRLQAAQRDADVETLDALLHPRVVAAGPDGAVFNKEDDLGSYRSGTLRITRLLEESIDVQDDGQTGTTRIIATVDAVQAGTEVSARLRYTRLWLRERGRWRVLAATFVSA